MADVARMSIGFFLLASGLLKLFAPTSTSQALAAVGVVQQAHVPLAIGLASAEIALGAALLISTALAVIALIASLLTGLSAFLVYLALRAPSVKCGCLGEFGFGDHRVGLVRNALLAALLVVSANGSDEPGLWAVAGGIQGAILLGVVTEGIYIVGQLRVLTARLGRV